MSINFIAHFNNKSKELGLKTLDQLEEQERQLAEQERQLAEQERQRAERENERAEQERQEKEGEQERAEQERQRAERENERAERENERAERENERAERENERAERENERAEQERQEKEGERPKKCVCAACGATQNISREVLCNICLTPVRLSPTYASLEARRLGHDAPLNFEPDKRGNFIISPLGELWNVKNKSCWGRMFHLSLVEQTTNVNL